MISNLKKRRYLRHIMRVSVFWSAFFVMGLSPVLCVSAADDETMLTEDFYAQPGFSSSMPLLNLEFEAGTHAQEEKSYYLEVAVQGLQSESEDRMEAIIRNMTDPSNMTDQKHDYFIRFEQEQDLLGTGSAHDYLLLGGMHDRSLLRNYTGYRMAEKIMPETVGFQLCELFFHDEKGDLYQGVYLLVALDIKNSPADLLFHRNMDGEGIPVDTGSAGTGYLSIPFMEGAGWDDRFNKAVGGLGNAEYVLYSERPQTFYQYPYRFDVSSFTGAFILGELTENYLGMTDAYYLYDDSKDRLSVAPVWNFDQAFDNQSDRPANTNAIYYSEAPYHESLLKSPQYTRRLQESYLAARQSGLEETDLMKIVDDGAAIVAPAVVRDWERWNDYSDQVLDPLTELEFDSEDADGNRIVRPVVPRSRQRESHQSEILRIKTALREHSLYFSYGITRFDFSEKEVSREIVLNANPVWAGVFLVVSFALIRFARRYGV